MKANQVKIYAIVVLLAALALACAVGGSDNTNSGDQGLAAQPTTVSNPTTPPQLESTQPQQYAGGTTLRQWATSAEATSSYLDDDYSAKQATGAPNTAECGDEATAWASESGVGLDTLTVYYDTPVYANQVVIYETYYPDQVIRVELVDTNNQLHQVLVKPAEDKTATCPTPFILTVDFETTDYLVKGVAITVDESFLNSWNEIDAVELVGVTP